MTLEVYLLFVGACILLVVAPGPDMIYLLGRSIAQGRRAGIAAAVGINSGAYVHLLAATTGLSAILMTSAVAFTVVKWVGAAYLVYLGVNALLSRGAVMQISPSGPATESLRTIFWQGFWSDVLNPKVAIFFLAFLPQFVDPTSGSIAGQLLILGLTANMIAIIVNLLLVEISGLVTQRLRHNALIGHWLQKAMGLVLVGLGVRLAAERG